MVAGINPITGEWSSYMLSHQWLSQEGRVKEFQQEQDAVFALRCLTFSLIMVALVYSFKTLYFTTKF